jgi:hypothetical protein
MDDADVSHPHRSCSTVVKNRALAGQRLQLGGEPKFRELEPDCRMAEICPALEGRRLTLEFRIHRSVPEAQQLVSNGIAPCGPPCSHSQLLLRVSLPLGPFHLWPESIGVTSR